MSTATRPRLVLVDDHTMVRSGVRTELGDAVDIVGEAGDVEAAIAAVTATRPDVVLLDVHLPGGDGRGGVDVLEGCRSLTTASGAPVRFLALSVSDAADDVIAVIRAGARGYVTKSISGTDLLTAVRRVADGDAGEEGLLDVQALDHGLDHEVAGGDGPLEVVLEVARGDPRGVGRVGVGGRSGLEQLRHRAEGEGVAGGLRRALRRAARHHVEEEGPDARGGEVGGDLRPHRASAEHRGRDGVGGTMETHGAAP